MEDGIRLSMNEDGEWAVHEEPYATIEFKTEEDYNMAIKALEKQIPKEFTSLDQDYGYFECSNCDHVINYGEDYTEHNYCLNCGQRLDWTEVVK